VHVQGAIKYIEKADLSRTISQLDDSKTALNHELEDYTRKLETLALEKKEIEARLEEVNSRSAPLAAKEEDLANRTATLERRQKELPRQKETKYPSFTSSLSRQRYQSWVIV